MYYKHPLGVGDCKMTYRYIQVLLDLIDRTSLATMTKNSKKKKKRNTDRGDDLIKGNWIMPLLKIQFCHSCPELCGRVC